MISRARNVGMAVRRVEGITRRRPMGRRWNSQEPNPPKTSSNPGPYVSGFVQLNCRRAN
jgi:hypothetical protein